MTNPKDKVENVHVEELDLSRAIEREFDLHESDELENNKVKEETMLLHSENNNGNTFTKRKQLPAVDPFSGFYYARKMHMDNLLHHPLPDTMGPRETRCDPTKDLDVKPYSAALNIIGQRPVTCVGTKKHTARFNNYDSMRPATSGGEKLQLSLKQQMTPMDLAICWDFRTADPRDEPKRSKHIDGSNGSLAPAVFSMVHTPTKNADFIPDTGRSNAIFSQNILLHNFEDDKVVPCFEKDMSKNRNKNACDVPKCPQHSCYENSKPTKNNGEQNSNKKTNRGKSALNKSECDGIHGCGTESGSSKTSTHSSTKNTYSKRKFIKNAWQDTVGSHNESKENHSTNVIQKEDIRKYNTRQRGGSLDHLNNNSEDSIQSIQKKDKICRSSPNVSKDSSDRFKDDTLSPCSVMCPKHKKKQKFDRNCHACEGNKKKPIEIHTKHEYKSAFKAGNPNSISSDSKNECSSNSTKNSLKIPKMRDPYSKKSYAIPTLHPPFSRWNDTSGYPEHWRLASVYQHAYKTPGPKRRPLLPAVYQ